MNVSYRKYHALKGLVLLLGIVLVLLLAFFATTVGVMDTVPLDVPRALISFFQGNLEGNAHYKVIVLMRLPVRSWRCWQELVWQLQELRCRAVPQIRWFRHLPWVSQVLRPLVLRL